ncbi:hypothetical protein FN846DRAFT_902637 [Sphaerosporella brunnea]|uniref:Uncharacterized protein n=1 Tax=Sphaerosporella brunnea TaxID=1250544 RepID=A0A5J5F9P9_9PEZI|nr:hypothetical protein FN846DRAFT_902637 [Sphaerosporella brunnea]
MNHPVFYLQESATLFIAVLFAILTICVFFMYNHFFNHSAQPSMTTASTQTVEKHGGLLTPPASPSMASQNAYSAFLMSSLPEELSDSPVELQQDVLFGDMDYALWAEVFGQGISSTVGSSFASISSLDLDEEASWGQ